MKAHEAPEPRCKACGSRHFSVRHTDKFIPPGIFKPIFTCLNCGHFWSCGKDGGPYMAKAREIKL